MRSGSQTFSRNQYAPIYGEREATALNPSTQPAVERSKSDREGHKCRRIEGSLPPNGPASAKPTGGRLRMYTNRRITSAAYLGLRRIAPLTSLERRLPNRRNRQFWSQNCRFYLESILSNDQRVEYCFSAAVLTPPFAFSCIVVIAFFSASTSAAITVNFELDVSKEATLALRFCIFLLERGFLCALRFEGRLLILVLLFQSFDLTLLFLDSLC